MNHSQEYLHKTSGIYDNLASMPRVPEKLQRLYGTLHYEISRMFRRCSLFYLVIVITEISLLQSFTIAAMWKSAVLCLGVNDGLIFIFKSSDMKTTFC